MLNIFKNLKEKKGNIESASDEEKGIMITTLLVEAAKSDDEFADEEITKIKKIVSNKLHFDEELTNSIFDKALETSQDSIELYSLTKDIKENFTKDEILNIFVYLWKVILSDGVIDDYESGLIRNLTGLFHLTGKEVAETKATAEELIKQN
ncbi:MAG: TerB family tellurite resistance protein [Alphaproteobacteria bacterium]